MEFEKIKKINKNMVPAIRFEPHAFLFIDSYSCRYVGMEGNALTMYATACLNIPLSIELRKRKKLALGDDRRSAVFGSQT